MRGKIERALLKEGAQIIGVDEVGKGCLAGPVVAACCSLDLKMLSRLKPKEKNLIRDSKTLSSTQRKRILGVLESLAVEYHIGMGTVEEIETLGLNKATFIAMNRALAKCSIQYDTVLIDGKLKIPDLAVKQVPIVKGDFHCFSIAAASIIAKEARDHFMRQVARDFPHYGFAANVGYGTREHLHAINKHGICHWHRRSFAPIKLVDGDHSTILPPTRETAELPR
jgi:ribonuclease HII